MTFAVGDRVVRNPLTMPDASDEVGVVSEVTRDSVNCERVSVVWPGDDESIWTYPVDMIDMIKPAPPLAPPRRWQRADGQLVDTGRGLACAVSRPDSFSDDRPAAVDPAPLELPREADRTTLGVAACCPSCGRMIDQPERP